MKLKPKKFAPENPRVPVVGRLLAMAEYLRRKSHFPDECEEALDWEKKLRLRASEIESAPMSKAA